VLEANSTALKGTIMTQSSSKKKHASFQSSYRRSLNFKHSAKQERFVLNEKGELVMRNDASEDE
jgi:hypothetical protein